MGRLAVLEQFRRHSPLIGPSMLKCDFGNLHREVGLLEAAGARVLHLDVMDGHFVPNLSYGPMVIQSLRQLTTLPFDAHLMISQPERYLDDYLRIGCEAVTFHVEAVSDPIPLLQRIQDADAVAGLAVNPGTPSEAVEPYLEQCDLVLVMSVEPGFGGQSFMPSVLDKLCRLRQVAPKHVLLSIDGGIAAATIGDAAAAGADLFVVGSGIFDASDYALAIAELGDLASASRPTLASS